MSTEPDAETQRRAERNQHFIRWLFPQLAGSNEERAATITMILASMHERYAEGIHDAGWVVQKLAAEHLSSKELRVASDALANLETITRRDMPTAI